MLNGNASIEKRVLAHSNARSIDNSELENVSGGGTCTTKATWTQATGADAEIVCTWDF